MRSVYTPNGLIISKMSGKLEGFMSINTNPLNNPYCNRMATVKECICSSCYSRRMLGTSRINCSDPWTRNGKILSDSVFHSWDLPDLTKCACNGAFRFSSHGELINEIHLINLCSIARRNPDITFGLWTKRVDMVQANLDLVLDNMVLVASTLWTDVQEPELPDGFHKVFGAYTRGYVEETGVTINCTGKCKDCMVCYRKDNGIARINEIVK